MADVNDLKVEKKDGSMVAFELDKVKTSVMNAGADPNQADQVTQEVANWVRSEASGVVKTSDIRMKVIELLKGLNPDAAKSYESYVTPS